MECSNIDRVVGYKLRYEENAAGISVKYSTTSADGSEFGLDLRIFCRLNIIIIILIMILIVDIATLYFQFHPSSNSINIHHFQILQLET